jgi:dihydroxyacetone kinase
VLRGVKCLRKKLVYITVIIAITLLGIAISYYFTNLMIFPKAAERQAATTIAVITTIIHASITSISARL